jgi:putative ATP-dependent endonuclease of OLD family
MRLKSIRIQNFRSFHDEVIEFGNYTCLVGANGAGKSNIICALNIFFRQYENYPIELSSLNKEDFHQGVIEEPIKITLTFVDLSLEAQEGFKHYYRQGELVVTAEARFDENTGRAEVRQYGQRHAIKDFARFFEAEAKGQKVSELKEIYSSIREKYPDLPLPGTKQKMLDDIRTFEDLHPEACELIPSEDQFYGVSRGKNLLEKYIQWEHIPPVKDVALEQTESRSSALGRLLARTVRAKIDFSTSVGELREQTRKQYQEILDANQSSLNEISSALNQRLVEWAHPGASVKLQWHEDPDSSVRVSEPLAQIIAGEEGFSGEIWRFGHGLQRAYLFALLQELAGYDEVQGPELLLGCEEPELYQHPPQARHMYRVFRKLSSANSQIIICTHSPYFISGENFEDIRMVKKEQGRSTVTSVSAKQLATVLSSAKGRAPIIPSGCLAQINQALQSSLSEMFFAQKVIFVEGVEDTAYITPYLHLMELWDRYHEYGCHLISTNYKSTMIQPVAVAKCMKIPFYVVFDSDSHKPDKNGSRIKHEKDNNSILSLCGVMDPEPFPDKNYIGKNVTMWKSELSCVVREEIGDENWRQLKEQADKEYGFVGNLDKNAMYISRILTLAWEKGLKSESLINLCERIVSFGAHKSG